MSIAANDGGLCCGSPITSSVLGKKNYAWLNWGTTLAKWAFKNEQERKRLFSEPLWDWLDNGRVADHMGGMVEGKARYLTRLQPGITAA